MRRLLAALILICTPLAPASAATEVIRIHAYVPLICRADFQARPAERGGLIELGSINEFCNSGSGYQVIAEYPAAADPGALVVDGQTVRLDGSGRALLATMNGPRLVTQSLAYLPGTTPIATIHIQLLATPF
jgi:hypothetical protein